MRVVKRGPWLNVYKMIRRRKKNMLYIKLDITTQRKKEGDTNLPETKSNWTISGCLIRPWIIIKYTAAVGKSDVMHSCQIKIPSFSVKISPMRRMQLSVSWWHVECRLCGVLSTARVRSVAEISVQEYTAHLLTWSSLTVWIKSEDGEEEVVKVGHQACSRVIGVGG